jgi:hypothetical protein
MPWKHKGNTKSKEFFFAIKEHSGASLIMPLKDQNNNIFLYRKDVEASYKLCVLSSLVQISFDKDIGLGIKKLTKVI